MPLDIFDKVFQIGRVQFLVVNNDLDVVAGWNSAYDNTQIDPWTIICFLVCLLMEILLLVVVGIRASLLEVAWRLLLS